MSKENSKPRSAEEKIVVFEGAFASREYDPEIKIPIIQSTFEEIKVAEIIKQKRFQMQRDLENIDLSDLESEDWDYDLEIDNASEPMSSDDFDSLNDFINNITPESPEIDDSTFTSLSDRYSSEFVPKKVKLDLTQNESSLAYQDLKYLKIQIPTENTIKELVDLHKLSNVSIVEEALNAIITDQNEVEINRYISNLALQHENSPELIPLSDLEFDQFIKELIKKYKN